MEFISACFRCRLPLFLGHVRGELAKILFSVEAAGAHHKGGDDFKPRRCHKFEFALFEHIFPAHTWSGVGHSAGPKIRN